MSDFGSDHGQCNMCGGTNGYHDYSAHGYDSNSGGFGGSGVDKLVFFIFCVIALPFLCFLPPIGALIVLLGAKITNV